MPPSPSAAVARAIASMPRDGSINDFTVHFLESLKRQGFEIIAARDGVYQAPAEPHQKRQRRPFAGIAS